MLNAVATCVLLNTTVTVEIGLYLVPPPPFHGSPEMVFAVMLRIR